MIPAHNSGAAVSSIEVLGQRVGVRLVDHEVLWVAAAWVPTGEAGIDTQVLPARPAEAADPARVGEPRHADTVTHREAGRALAGGVEMSDDLVPRDHPGALGQQVAPKQVEEGAEHATRQ